MRVRVALTAGALAVLVAGAGATAALPPVPDCVPAGPLHFQTAWIISDCVVLGEGTFEISRSVLIPEGKTLRGAGAGKTIITIASDWRGDVMVLGHSTRAVAFIEN